jgi:small-conductance mechanosensitive channel
MKRIHFSSWVAWAVVIWVFFYWGGASLVYAGKGAITASHNKEPAEILNGEEIEKKTKDLKERIKLAQTSENKQRAGQIKSGPGQEGLKGKLAEAKSEIRKIWDFEVWNIDNRSVTIRKLGVTLFILIIGMLMAKYLLSAIAKRFLPYTQLKETTAAAIQKLFTYFAYLLILIFALRIVNIPLAAFAFLGGAIAIGLGFGAQNLINNFISGFIIMGERPISIGDIIEVEGVLGKVQEIGARCTRIRTGENIHILVPNSSFLERNITNWTLSDQKIRAHVTVGVVYGSPVGEVERLLLRAVSEKEEVIKEPEPFVLFGDFGDNALIFQIHFWISIRRIIERRLIESGVRFRIDKLFREAGIVIAFPQRDVHLDSKGPLELRLVDAINA